MRAEDLAFRLACFGAVLLLLALWETLAPKRPLSVLRPLRWFNNFALLALGWLALRLCLPLLAMDAAKVAADRGWGLLNHVRWPFPLKLALGVLFLDLVIYLQHRTFHNVPLLWRLHKVHHTDLDLDVSTGLRFHPAEILLSMGIKMGAVVLIGAHFGAVLLFEVVLNAGSLFTHANIRVPAWLDGALRLAIVTPDMHRIHHSVSPEETNSNYGFNFSWWDRLLRTYRPEPELDTVTMPLGLPAYRAPLRQSLPWLLALPFNRS